MQKFINISGSAKKAAVIGNPIAHSLSPKLHNYLLGQYRIDGLYMPVELQEADLKDFIKIAPKIGLKGFNVTLPFKEKIVEHLDEIDEKAKMIGAVNTVIIKDDAKLYGTNSDCYGFIENVKSSYPDYNFKEQTAIVLGAGGAARSVCFALAEQGVRKILIVNRTLKRAEELAKHFSGYSEQLNNCRFEAVRWDDREDILPMADILVNATTLGMVDSEELNLKIRGLSKKALVIDVVYTPYETKLIVEAKCRGNKTVTGIGMLIHQAMLGFENWFGIKPKIDYNITRLMSQWAGNE